MKTEIALIEDNPGDVFLLEMALQANQVPYHLTRFEIGEDALGALCTPEGVPGHDFHTDAILLDLNTPKSDGFEVLGTIGKIQASPTCRSRLSDLLKQGVISIGRVSWVLFVTSRSPRSWRSFFRLSAWLSKKCSMRKPSKTCHVRGSNPWGAFKFTRRLHKLEGSATEPELRSFCR